MSQVIYILIATLVFLTTCLLTGGALLSWAGAERVTRDPVIRNWGEALFLSFLTGAACLSLIVLGLASIGMAWKAMFYAAAAVSCAVAVWSGAWHRLRSLEALPTRSLGPGWQLAFWTIYAVFGGLYVSVAMAPETSADGAGFHLGEVATYLSQRGFTFDQALAQIPDAVEMLFLFAFSIGKHSAAAMVELLFLLLLPFGLLSYGHRAGETKAGAVAGLLIFLSPIAGLTGTIAAPDVAVAAFAFGAFYLIDIVRPGAPYWRRRSTLLLPAALVILALVWVMTPWLLREFSKLLLRMNAFHWRLPLDAAAHGIGGVLGPVFLLAPVALLAAGKSEARKVLLAALLLAIPCVAAMETRILLPSLTFLSMAMGFGLARIDLALPSVLAFHTILSWPGVVALYADENVALIPSERWKAALRLESEDEFLAANLPGYEIGRVMEAVVPDGDIVLSTGPFQFVYHTRTLLDGEQSERGRQLREIIWAAAIQNRQPVVYRDYRFPPTLARRVGLLPLEFEGQGRWGVNELRVYSETNEIERSEAWRVAATPNPELGEFAVDRNPATRWTTGRAARDSMGFTLEFGRQNQIDHVLVVASDEQDRPLLVLLETPAGDWEPVDATENRYTIQPPGSLRSEAIDALRSAGVGWLLVHQGDLAAEDILNHLDQWELEVDTVTGGRYLLKIRDR